jgi:hypothetical protein
MSTAATMPISETGVLGIFVYVDVAVEGMRRLRERGWRVVRVHAPVPSHALMEEVEPRAISPVRVFALVGGIAGTLAGFALASFAGWKMHSFQGLLVGGKPPIALPAYFIIGFELTVLIGALATLAGFLINARLPKWRAAGGYDDRFSDDRFGIFVPCDRTRWDEVRGLLTTAGAEEVRIVEGD